MFPGGVHPREGVNGKAVTKNAAIQVLEAPPRVTIPLRQHIGAPCKCVVEKGDYVKVGQVIGEAAGLVSAPVHASVSGTVVATAPYIMADGLQADVVVIDNDFTDTWIELAPVPDAQNITAQTLLETVRNAGIVGLGGATFPTAVKLNPPNGQKIETLIINGAECEPYLSADHRLMLENAQEVIDGISLTLKALQIPRAIIGVEDNKADAIAALGAQIAKAGASQITVKALPVRYPQGGEKQLIYALIKKKVPNGALPIAVGTVVCNVATVAAISDAVRKGRPLIDRVVTVGGLVHKPGNFRVRVGSPVETLINAAGGFMPGGKQFIMGGPMMGQSIARWDIPVTKGCSGILVLGQEAMEPKESACIRCGRCLDACPMGLVPTYIDRYMRADRFDLAEETGAMNCIECGACTYSCPSKRSLTQSCRVCKKIIGDNRKKAAAAQKEG